MKSAEVFQAFCLLLWLMQNFFMSIAFDTYPHTNRLGMLSVMLSLNAFLVFSCYRVGLRLLHTWPFDTVCFLSIASVAGLQMLFWGSYGLKKELKGIAIAQLLASLMIVLFATIVLP